MKPEVKAQMKVWRPKGFQTIEIAQLENVPALAYPAVVLAGYDLTVAYTSGAVRFEYGREHYLHEGGRRFYLRHPGELFSATPRDATPTSVRTLRFYPQALEQLVTDLDTSCKLSYFPEMMVPAELNDILIQRLTEAISAFDSPASSLERETKLLELVYTLSKHCSDAPPEYNLGREHKAVSLVKEVLRAHPELEFRLENLSALTKLNKFYLHKIFVRDVGLSPFQYQTGLRVEKAKALLVNCASAAQAATEAGFYDQSHLNRVFKKYTQVTPREFQKHSLAA